jgi:2-(1,2-epoxy-1,2-dihydrophenyl)acetyl-CoA isomerase
MEYQTLIYELKDNVAHITLNRPEVGNALNDHLARELMQAILCCEENPEVRVVLLKGTGKMFCGGGDVSFMKTNLEHLSMTFKEMVIYVNCMLSKMTHMNAPVIAVAHGNNAGGGVSLLSAADIVIASEGATFTPAYTGIGLSPDAGFTYFLPRLIGLRRALDLTLTNRRLTAQEALEWGFVTRIAPDEQVFEQAEALAAQLAGRPTLALGAAKRLLRDGWAETMETHLEIEGCTAAEVTRSEDFQEGVRAFMERRRPVFKGT